MKRTFMFLAVGLLTLAGLPSFAQDQSQSNTNPKDAYYKTIPIIKIWMAQEGYLVQFWNSHSQVADIYVPIDWFNKGTDSKADIVYGNEPGYPYCSIFWVDGKFDHIVLYVLDNYHSPTWGVLEPGSDQASKFNIQEVSKEF